MKKSVLFICIAVLLAAAVSASVLVVSAKQAKVSSARELLSRSGKISCEILEESDVKDGKYLVMIFRRDIPMWKVAAELKDKYGYDMDVYEYSEDESLDWDGYAMARRNVLKSLYLGEANAFIEEVGLDRKDIIYLGWYTGTIAVYASPETILRCAESDYAVSISPFSDDVNDPASIQVTGEEK